MVEAEAVAVVEVQAEAEVEVQVDTVVKEVFTAAQLEDRLATENSLNLHTKVKAKEDHMATEPNALQEILAIPTVLNARLTAHNAMVKDHHLVTVLNARLMVNANLTLEEIPVEMTVHQEILAIPTVLNARLTAHNAMEKDHHLVTVHNARLMVNANLTLEEIPVDAMEIVDLSAA